MAPRQWAWPMGSRARTALIPCFGQQRMALGDRSGHVDHRPVAAARVVAEAVERLALGDAVALHEDALRPLDECAALERRLESLDLLDELALLLVPAHRHLDRGLDRVRAPLARVRGDAAL